MLNEAICVGITGIHFAGSPSAGPNVIRSLRESTLPNIKLYALTNYPISPALGMRNDIEDIFSIPFASQGARSMLRRIVDITSQQSLQVIIPNDDEDVLSFASIQSNLMRHGVQMLLPSLKVIKSVIKNNISETFLQTHTPMAKTRVIRSLKELAEKDLKYPSVLKGLFHDAYLARDHDEAVVYFRKIRNIWGLPVIFQEFLYGEEYAIVCIADLQSRLVSVASIKKIGITEKGKTWCGCMVENSSLVRLAEEVIEKLGWIGPMEIELIHDQRNDIYTIIEINPRFPAWIYLVTAAGQNMPEIYVKLAIGQQSNISTSYLTSKFFMRVCGYTTYPIASVGQLMTSGHLKL